MKTKRWLGSGIGSVALTLAWSPMALALVPAPTGECAVDADCQVGFVCEVVGASTCGSPGPCLEGETCPDPVPCESQVFYGCVPGPCQSDADCDEGLKCAKQTFTECSGGGSAGGVECDAEGNCKEIPVAVEMEECTTTTRAECRPQWEGQCDVDADCGPGFACVAAEVCWCNAGAPTPPDGAPPAMLPPAPDQVEECGCDATGESYCQPLMIPCQADSDCDAGLTCQSAGFAGCDAVAVDDPAVDPGVDSAGEPEPADAGVDTASGDGAGGGEDGGAADQAKIVVNCDVAEPVMWCLPPNYSDFGGWGWAEAQDSAGIPTAGGGQSMDPSGNPDDKTDRDAVEEDGAAPPSAGDTDGAGLLCSAAPGRASGAGFAWLLALPTAWLFRRRRCSGR